MEDQITSSLLGRLEKKANLAHRDLLELTLSGEVSDRLPVALWRHFPVDDQKPETLAWATLQFQATYDFDLVKVTPASSFCLKDWGAEDVWRGNPEGTRDYLRRIIQQPEDWASLDKLDPRKGFLGDQIRCLQMITKQAGPNVPIIQTIFSPLSQAKNLVGGEALIVQLRKDPDAVHQGLKTIADTTLDFIAEASAAGISGIFFAVQHAQYGLLSEAEFLEFGKKYDLMVLDAVQSLWLNMVHLHGSQVMFDLVCDYPVQVLNWHDRETQPDLAQAASQYAGVMCGGLNRSTMVLGTPEDIRAELSDAVQATGGKRLILGTGCVLPIITPIGNIQSARRAVSLTR